MVNPFCWSYCAAWIALLGERGKVLLFSQYTEIEIERERASTGVCSNDEGGNFSMHCEPFLRLLVRVREKRMYKVHFRKCVDNINFLLLLRFSHFWIKWRHIQMLWVGKKGEIVICKDFIPFVWLLRRKWWRDLERSVLGQKVHFWFKNCRKFLDSLLQRRSQVFSELFWIFLISIKNQNFSFFLQFLGWFVFFLWIL